MQSRKQSRLTKKTNKMKKLLLLFAFAVSAMMATAQVSLSEIGSAQQDETASESSGELPSTLITTDGDIQSVYVTEIASQYVYYKAADGSDSQVHMISKSDVVAIKKADGTKYDLSDATVASTTSTSSTSSSDDLSFRVMPEFIKPESGWGLGFLHIQAGYVDLGWYFGFGEENDYISSNEWNKGFLGGCYEFGANPFYINLAAGLMYSHSVITYGSGSSKQEEKNGEFGLYLNPRINLYFYTSESGGKVGVTAGYHWDFVKFKFDEDYTDKYWSFGIVIGG